MKALGHLIITVALLAIAACAAVPETTLITGSLGFRSRPALPAGAKADVVLANQSQPTAAALAQQSIAAGDGQTPLRFEFRLAGDQLQATERYAVHATVWDASGNLLFTTDRPYPVAPAQQVQDLGVLTLVAVPARAPAPSRPSNPATGTAPASNPNIPPGAYVARGNEPGWMLVVAGKRLTVDGYRATKLQAVTPAQQKIPGGYRYAAKIGKDTLRIDVLNRICADTMSGLRFPDTVTVMTGNRTLRGCGGDPAFLLQHARWLVTTIDGQEVAPTSRPTLVFETTGRVTGHASCNSYSGPYRLTGEGLSFGPMISTKRACEPALMAQESAMLAALQNAARHELSNDGTLTIESSDGHRVVARKG